MRWTVALLVVAGLAGCLDADEDPQCDECTGPMTSLCDTKEECARMFAEHENRTADRTLNETIPDAALPEPTYTEWWMPCDWSGFEPSPARGVWTERKVLHIAHQGGENEVPSATMYALKTSLRKGADLLEIDVHMTADGEIVVLHDTSVDRTTDGSGAVEDLTLAEIKALDAAYWFVPEQHRPVTPEAAESEYVLRGIRAGERPPPPDCTPEDFTIPTLREVLAEFPDVMMNIEIKNGLPQSTTTYEQELADLLVEYGRGSDTIVASFVDTWTEFVHLFTQDGIDTSTGTGQTAIAKIASLGPLPGAPTLLHEAFQVPIEFNGIEVLDRDCDFIDDAHAVGMAVHVWTINDPDDMRWLIECGADGIMTAEPTVLEAVIEELGVAWT